MPSEGLLITAGGIPHLIDHGYLTLLARGWQMAMEYGDEMYLQLLPVWHVPPVQGVVPSRVAGPSESRIFSELMIECLMKDGQSLLIAIQTEQVKAATGLLDEGGGGVRLGEALLGSKSDNTNINFLLFEAHVGSLPDN